MAKQPAKAPIFRPQGNGEIPPIHTHPMVKSPNTDHELYVVHQNLGSNLGDLDNVDRSETHPDIPELDIRIMGRHQDEPVVVENKGKEFRLSGRSSLKPGKQQHGDFSSTHNKHELNYGGRR
jgi:hypothetical protein